MSNGIVEGAFLLPVIGDKFYLMQRATNPFKGYWGAVGGKSDALEKAGESPWNKPRLITKMGGHQVISIADEWAMKEGRELPRQTAIREFCEEIYEDEKFPDDFREEDVSDIYKIGYIGDIYEKNGEQIVTDNHFHVARVHRTDFSPSPREVSGFKPLEELTREDKIFPLTKAALIHLFWMHFNEMYIPFGMRGYSSAIEGQISLFMNADFLRKGELTFEEERNSTGMLGVIEVIRGYSRNYPVIEELRRRRLKQD